ncbi:FkbM family methyltransferase [Sphingobium sp. B2D3A]|uniref:FkbM family methyltransferase n=1 Tax=unclassified Sphingobium TaxID=2611147 RepID=UPI00222537F4|nr:MULTISPECIES: FkbM family methyltransferase [unclassified Sphingobium]MCW2338508.1 FkbM family methyltransferase [Sphingobium sp. B2D3A]MCW2384966.1 FkbM family methyltransferase [Sphingobium sp. B2D3D]
MPLEIRSATKREIGDESTTLPVLEMDVSGQIVRYVLTSRHSSSRARTLLTKEPLTIPWITTVKAGEVFVDIGANVGTYAIYAGVIGARVFAFEPEALNYAELNKNIFVNNLHGRVTAYCMAISDQADVSVLHLSAFVVAGSHHDYGENWWKSDRTIGNRLVKREQRPQQGCISYSLDELVARQVLPQPNHIKIDVDGFENKVVRGAAKTLQSPDLKTVLLEVDFRIPESLQLVDHMRSQGWKTSDHQLRINQHEYMPDGKLESLMQRGKGGANFIFFRDDEYFRFFEEFAETFVPPNPPVAKVTA